METLIAVIVAVAFVLFAAAAVMAVIRIIRGPGVVDRMVSSDTLATIMICALCADMALRGHTTTLPLVLALAMSAAVGTMAVARFVSRGRSGNTLTDTRDRHVDDIDQHPGEGQGGSFRFTSRNRAAAHRVVAKQVHDER